MSPQSMAEACATAINGGCCGGRVTFILPKGWKRPPKFPRGELLSEIEREGRVSCAYSFDPLKVLVWLTANELISVKVHAAKPVSP